MVDDKKKFDFEDAMKKLENIASSLESGDLPLDDLEKQFTEGLELAKGCEKRLSGVESRVEMLLEGDDGQVSREEFEEE
jgi:exodeoxyribonuclease VII small subunit